MHSTGTGIQGKSMLSAENTDRTADWKLIKVEDLAPPKAVSVSAHSVFSSFRVGSVVA